MSYPKRVNLYSSEFYRLACEISDHPDEPFMVECKDHNAAVYLRLQFYSFRNAARKHREDGDMAHFQNIDFIEVTIPKINGKPGNVVQFQSKDVTEVSRTLKAALDKREQESAQ